ncbi:hypothetical protein YA0089_24880 [Pseudomonas viridiflava]|uniref:hypothetical protein n=1 Tax=Pseudomonas viridiflava TaxID=33069 RepID=UPI0018E60AD0|nr:hypothetical protein [Pseudomonas viridiflava]MBI6726850.1 hypothetical protein [Pseudomonas viridiflava]
MSDAAANEDTQPYDVIIIGGGGRFDFGFDVVADLLARDAMIEPICILPLAQHLLYAWICEENFEHYHIQKPVIFSLKRRSIKALPCQPRSPPQ